MDLTTGDPLVSAPCLAGGSCVEDIRLTGSKIAKYRHRIGMLDGEGVVTDDQPPSETLQSETRRVVYRIQRFSELPGSDTVDVNVLTEYRA